MRKRRVVQLMVLVVLLAGGAVAFFQIVPKTTVNFNKMKVLMITDPHLKDLPSAPTAAAPSPIAGLGLASLEQGAVISPGQTGAYSATWLQGTSETDNNLSIFVELLPTVTLAEQAQKEQSTKTESASSLSAVGETAVADFSIAGFSDSEGVAYSTPQPDTVSKKGKLVKHPGIPGYTVIVRSGRGVVRSVLDGPASTKASIVAVSTSEGKLLETHLADWPSMSSTAYPLGPSLAVWAIVLALLLVDFLAPVIFDRAAAAQREREEARRRYALKSRGAKVVRRRRTPVRGTRR